MRWKNLLIVIANLLYAVAGRTPNVLASINWMELKERLPSATRELLDMVEDSAPVTLDELLKSTGRNPGDLARRLELLKFAGFIDVERGIWLVTMAYRPAADKSKGDKTVTPGEVS